MYNKVDFFVYSGTGNTYKIAETIGEIAAEKGMSFEINMIDCNAEPQKYEVNNDNLLGLMAPTLGFIQPLSFFKFIMRLPKGKGMNVFLVATGAWTKIGNYFLPGCIGFGLYLGALILLIKGYKIVGIDGVGMPHNWTTFFPPYTKKLESRILNELKSQVTLFADAILEGKKVYKKRGDLIFGILVFPISILFIFMSHLMFAKSMFTNHKCNGCGLCNRICPKKAIEGSLPMVVIYCLLLELIELNVHVIGILQIQNKAAGFSIYYITFILVIVLGYILFFLFNRIKVFNRIFTYSTFTFYWRKYKEPSVDIKKLFKILD